MTDSDKVDPFATYIVPRVSRIERWRRRVRDAPENIRLERRLVRDVKESPDGFVYFTVENKGIFKIVPKE